MSRWFNKLSLISLVALQGHVWGWGSQYTPHNLQVPESPPTIQFPLNETQAWFVKPSYLIWRPHQDGINFGYKHTYDEVGFYNTQERDKYLNLDFGWGSGVRLGIGRYLPSHDQWDITAFMTYLYDSSSSEFHANVRDLQNDIAGDSSIISLWSFGLTPDSVPTSRVNWQLNYFTWDLSIGRHYSLTRALAVHPYLGLRAALIDQKYTNSNIDLSQPNGPGTAITTSKTHLKAYNDFWGVGARLGSEFFYCFGRGWSFIGSFAGSFLLGRYDMKENLSGYRGSIELSLKANDADTVLKTNLEGTLGLGWEKWVRDHTVRIAPSFLFEITEWYSINQWVQDLQGVPNGSPALAAYSRRPGQRDFGLLGFTVNLQIDF